MICPNCSSEFKRKCKACGFVKVKLVKEKKVKETKSETQLVHEYVAKVVRGKQSRGHVDERFAFTKQDATVNKNLWLDTDFFFSVVFQSEAQKYAFLKAAGWPLSPQEEEGQIQIVNGLKLAQALGVKLKIEKRLAYPQGDLELRPFVMDMEE
jgi:hypothetical protein